MSQSGPGQRETAYRLFAAEFEDSELSYSESDEERAPNYVVTPTGARVNRLFAVGVLTEIEDVNPEMVRGRVVDPTGAFVTYAGQYQPDALAFLERVDPPLFLALSGKARTYEPEDGDRIFTSVRPESVNEVDAETRDRWVVTAAERTLERVGVAAAAIDSGLSGDRLEAALLDAGVGEGLAEGVALAVEHYGTTPAYLDALRGLAIDAVRVVAGERDEVDRLGVAPDEGGGDASSLSTLELSAPDATASSADAAGAAGTAGADSPDDPGSVGADPAETSPEPSDAGAGEVEASREPGVDGDATPETTSDPADGAGSEAGGATEPAAPTGSSAADGPATTEPGSDPDPDPNPDGAGTAATVGASGSERDAAAGSDPDGAGSTRDEQASSGAEAPTAGTGTTTGTETGAASDTGDSEPGGVDSESGEADPDGFDPGEFELDDEERREVEEEYGTEFSTAGEVDPPESADTPEAGSDAAPTGGQTEATPDPSAAPEPADAEGSTTDAEPADAGPRADAETASETDESAPTDAEAGTGSEEGDLVDAVMDAMKDLDEGEGADREALIDAVADERGVSADAVEESIQEALMSGRCYEPSDDALKPI